ncbi:histidine phosphatase superfamily [Rhypophila decipiens]|uniref:Histidine phosphatase superfamily n=1 Tax=Rhypophila decipiens TaxID=261697 RepID=A0AAN6YC21_9PEZI|nr:histidine phosphatase superfamily [Rhypophila decipiens]
MTPSADGASATRPNSKKYRFTAVTGYFKHDSEPIGPPFESITLPSLGLINKPYPSDSSLPARSAGYTPWERFTHHLSTLNQDSPPSITYKLLYYTRHGQGYHNVQESKVGTIEWERYWARLDGDGNTTWADAHLTSVGEDQAKAVNKFLLEESSTDTDSEMGILPLPTRHYVSPLTRCLQTWELAYKGIRFEGKPLVKEMVRERLGIHTCDRRSFKSEIEKYFGDGKFVFEEGFTEKDELWVPDVRESIGEHAARIHRFLEDVFEDGGDGDDQIVGVTAHSGSGLALYELIGHPSVRLAPGTLVPVLVRGERFG